MKRMWRVAEAANKLQEVTGHCISGDQAWRFLLALSRLGV
jgi:uncharacterized protein affecting Mg2+/Co2+ transport